MDRRPLALAAATLLAGCLIKENTGFKPLDTAAADETTDATPTSTGGETCPDGQPARAWYPDADADGFGDDDAEPVACDPPAGSVDRAGDCVDTDRNIHPDAEEICNGRDDNCNGDDDEVTKCDGCKFTLTEKYVYWACPRPEKGPKFTQQQARDRCQTFSARFAVDLVSVHSGEEHSLVAELAEDHLGGYPGGVHAWIGLRKTMAHAKDCDVAYDVGHWEWFDNSAVDNTKWLDDEPSGPDCDCGTPGCAFESCVELTRDPDDSDKLGWNDVACDAKSVNAYICKTARDPELFPGP